MWRVRGASGYLAVADTGTGAPSDCPTPPQNLLGNTLISATFYSQAGKAMSKVDPGEALKCYRHAVERYSTVGRMVQAAVVSGTAAQHCHALVTTS